MFELGTHKSKLWRSSKNEWFGGTKGFYWGCNNAKDLEVRLETVASLEGQPANVVFHPSDRDRTWLQLFEEHKGKIDADFGFEAFTTPPLAASPSLDAKFTTTAMARELKTWALFGPPLGRTWEPTDVRAHAGSPTSARWSATTGRSCRRAVPSLRRRQGRVPPSISPSSKQGREDGRSRHSRPPRSLPAAWHGTILPRSDADIWLAAAFADYEKIVALEQAIREQGRRSHAQRRPSEIASTWPCSPRARATWPPSRAARQDIPLAEIRVGPDPRRVVSTSPPARESSSWPRCARDARRRRLPKTDGRLRPSPRRQARLD